MADFPGLRQAMAAMAGTGAIEASARAGARADYLTNANRMATLDKRLADAKMAQMRREAMEAYKAEAAGDPLVNIVLGNLGTNYSAAQQGFGRDQQNQARGTALELAQAAAGGGPMPDVDIMNLLTGVAGDKLLGPGNVRVDEQARGDIALDAARAGQARAAAEKAGRWSPSSRTQVIEGAGFEPPSMDVLLQHFGQDANVIAPNFYAFQRDMAKKDPAYKAGDFALAMYQIARQDGAYVPEDSGVTLSPEDQALLDKYSTPATE